MNWLWTLLIVLGAAMIAVAIWPGLVGLGKTPADRGMQPGADPAAADRAPGAAPEVAPVDGNQRREGV